MSLANCACRNDLWAEAVEKLNDCDRSAVNFSDDKLTVLVKLQLLAEKSKDECIQRRWKYTRKSGETVILRDVFEKMITWIKTFEKVGSTAVQYDPVHAALPWAGIRFILQVCEPHSCSCRIISLNAHRWRLIIMISLEK